jgi:hypothetical protein
MENLKKTVPRANRICTGRSLCLLAELGMKDSDGSAGSSSNCYQGKERCPVENIGQYPSFEAMRLEECRAQKPLFIERVIEQRSRYTAPYVFNRACRKIPDIFSA